MDKYNAHDEIKHVYETDSCSGCGIIITNDYTEVGMASFNRKEIKHIALCQKCSELTESYEVF